MWHEEILRNTFHKSDKHNALPGKQMYSWGTYKYTDQIEYEGGDECTSPSTIISTILGGTIMSSTNSVNFDSASCRAIYHKEQSKNTKKKGI